MQSTKARVSEMLLEQENLKRGMASRYSAVEHEAARIAQLRAEEALAAERAAAAANVAEDASVPKIKHALSLYANISNIRWDFTVNDCVKGFIVVKNDVDPLRPFEYETGDAALQFAAVNSIWNLMD